MKILIVNENLQLGGAQNLSVELANALCERDGLRVYFAAADGPLRGRLNPKILYSSFPAYRPLSVPAIIAGLKRIVSKIKPDLIHHHGGTIFALTILALRKSKIKPANIFSHHSQNFTRLPSSLSVFLLNRYSDHVVALSRHKYDQLIGFGVQKDKTSIIPNFVDFSHVRERIDMADKAAVRKELGIPDDARVVTMVGRLFPRKGFDSFVDILSLCSGTLGGRLFGLIIGDGPLRDEIKKRAAKHGDIVNILFLGYQDDIYKYLSLSDVFLFPSEYEILPMALIEASAAGVPIVCSNIPGNRDIVTDAHNGFLVSGFSPERYCKRVGEIINDKNLALSISENGIKLAARRFDKEIVIGKIESLYRKVLSS